MNNDVVEAELPTTPEPMQACLDLPARPRLSFRENFGWILSSNVVYSACQFGSLILLARIATTDQVGVYSLALAIATPLAMLSNLNLRSLQLVDLEESHPLSDILTIRYAAGMLALLIAFLIGAASGLARDTQYTILLMVAAQTIESISDSYYGILQRQEIMDRIAKSMHMRAVASVLSLGTIVALTHSILYGVAGIALVRLLILLCYDTRAGLLSLAARTGSSFPANLACLRPVWNPRGQRNILWKIAPLGGVYVIASLNGNIPRYFVELSSGHTALAVFAALSALPGAGALITNAVGNAAMPRLVRAFNNSPLHEYKRLLMQLLMFSGLLGLAGVLAAAITGEAAIHLLFGRNYAHEPSLLVLLMIAGGCQYAGSALGCGLTSASEFRIQLPILAVVATTCLGSSVMLIPRFGIVGGALAMLISSAIHAGLMAIFTLHAAAKRARTLREVRQFC